MASVSREWASPSRRLALARFVTFCAIAALLVLLQAPAHAIAAGVFGAAAGAVAAALACGVLLGLPLGMLFRSGAVTLAVLAALPASGVLLVNGGAALYAALLPGFLAGFAWLGTRLRPRRVHFG